MTSAAHEAAAVVREAHSRASHGAAAAARASLGSVQALLAAGLERTDAFPERCALKEHRGAREALATMSADRLARFPSQFVSACGARAPMLPMQLATVALLVDGCVREAVVEVARRGNKDARGAAAVARARFEADGGRARADLLCAPTGTGKTAVCLTAAAHIVLAQGGEYAAAAPAALYTSSPCADVALLPTRVASHEHALVVVPAHLAAQWERAAALQRAVHEAHYGAAARVEVVTYEQLSARCDAVGSARDVYPVIVYDEADENLNFAPARPPVGWRTICVAASALAAAQRIVPLDRHQAPAPDSWIGRLLAGAGGALEVRAGRATPFLAPTLTRVANSQERLATLCARDVLRGARAAVLEGVAARMPRDLRRHAVDVSIGADEEAGDEAWGDAAPARAARTMRAVAGGADAVAAALKLAPEARSRLALAARVEALAAGSLECPVCLCDRRAMLVAPCCAAAVCLACAARHAASRADATCVMCRAPPAPGGSLVRLLAPGAQPLEDALEALASAPHASLAHAVSAVASALVCDGGCRRLAVVGRLAEEAEWVGRLRDLLAAPPACCEVLTEASAGQRATWAATADPSPAALAVGANVTADVVGLDLAGADAIVTVGRGARVDEIWRRCFRVVAPGARLPAVVHHVSVRQSRPHAA